MRKSIFGKLRVLGLFCFSLLALQTVAQLSLVYTEGNLIFNEAKALFDKEKYVPAQQRFSDAINAIKDHHSEIRIDAEYYNALCAIELFHSNADVLLKHFLERHPESSHKLSAYFYLAKFQFRKKRYEDVLAYLSSVDPIDLNERERAEYYFKKGYSHFELNEYQDAASAFYEIKDTDNPFVSAARYYYAHIAYHEKKYETAAQNFLKIEKDKQFGPLVPFYLTQIYYLQNKYDSLLAYAPAVLDSAPPKREDEIRKLIGNAYYETKKFKEAIPFLEGYIQKNTASHDDSYQLGYSYYKIGEYDEAIKNLQKAISENDTLSQNAYYYIGESNIKTGSKSAAKDAFRAAYKLDANPELKEDALFNYAKTAYELSFHPYDDAILAFEEYINNYPESSKLETAYEYLVGVYYTTKNYKEALASIDRIKDKSIRLLEAKQRIAHYRGIELFREKKFKEAIELFTVSKENNYNPELFASSTFWSGEAYYYLKDYDNADDSYSSFLSGSGSIGLPFYSKGFYGLAYSNYKAKKYKSAIFWFREYIDNAEPEHVGLINDAMLRAGDSYFVQKDYRNAIDYYGKVIKLNVYQQDYALLQSAISYGVISNYKEKSAKLLSLINDFPKSIYHDDALFELGKTYLILNRENDALAYYNQLINDYPKSSYLAEAYLKVGLIHYNLKQDEVALASFDKVVKEFPSSSESKEALDKIRNIFIAKADAQGFEKYIEGVPFADISQAKLDSTAYVIAENNYLDGQCEKATRDFTNYLKRYPKGLFNVNAHYYRAECESKSNFEQEAFADYKFVVNQGSNKFIEKALIELGRLSWSLGELDTAIHYYSILKSSAERQQNKEMAVRALMDLNFEKKNYQEASIFAQSILEQDGIDESLVLQAHLIVGKSAFETEDYSRAIEHLNFIVNQNNEQGAESKYMLSRIYYLQGNYDKSDTLIYKLVDQVPSSPYWIAKGFILLADNFISKGDYYNARITFQSVIDNSEDQELVNIASEKLSILKQSEELNQTNETKPIEILLDDESKSDQSLFEIDENE